MPSLNQLASRISHLVGKPDDHALKERAKQMVKDYYAKYIIQSIDRNGIHDWYKLTLNLKVEPDIESAVYNDNGDVMYYQTYRSVGVFPKPMNLKNDSPFMSVVNELNQIYSYRSAYQQRSHYPSAPTRAIRSYSYVGGVITLKHHHTTSGFSIRPIVDNIDDPLTIKIEGIWESPEEVLGYYTIDDCQDYDLPFPIEMTNLVIADILKTEFNMIPNSVEILK